MSGLRPNNIPMDHRHDYHLQQQYYYPREEAAQYGMGGMDSQVSMPHYVGKPTQPLGPYGSGGRNPFGPMSGNHRSASSMPMKSTMQPMGRVRGNSLTKRPEKHSFDMNMNEFPSLGDSTPAERVVNSSYGPERRQVNFDFSSKDSFPALPSAGGGKRDSAPPRHATAKQQESAPRQPGAAAPKQEANKYGLLGLLNVIRMTDPDLNTLALGTDLTTLGVNLNADVLYATFDSPWSDTPTTIQPQFTLPTCYGIKSSRPKFEHFPEYELGTLFFIFYVMTMDASQAYAAQELNKRKWKYHKGSKTWFSIHQDSNRRIFFDRQTWETRFVAGDAAELRQEDFMSEHELKSLISRGATGSM